MEGILIIVDGIDGAGKTTQVNLLADALEKSGESVVRSKEPTSGVWGRKLRESAVSGRMSLEEELRTFVLDRKDHVATIIQPALRAGKIVILDRYFYSTIAYQGARGADAKSVAGDMRAIFPIPDVAFLIDAEPTTALDRIATGRGIPQTTLNATTNCRRFVKSSSTWQRPMTLSGSSTATRAFRPSTGRL